MVDFFLAYPLVLVGLIYFAIWATESLARRLG